MQGQHAGDADKPVLIEHQLRRLEAYDRKARDVEHVVAAQPRIAHSKPRIDRGCVDSQVEEPSVLLGVENNRAFGAAKVPTLFRYPKVGYGEVRRGKLGLDSVGFRRSLHSGRVRGYNHRSSDYQQRRTDA